MVNIVDNFLDRLTMYRVVLYVLIGYICAGMILGFLGFLPYSPFAILFSAILLTGVCYITNKIFAHLFRAPSNVESTYITALILALIISPAFTNIIFLAVAGCLAMASKYIISFNRKHIFNPAAIALVLIGFFLHQYASWWIGTEGMLPFVLIGGFLVLRKIQRTTLVLFFLIAVSLVTSFFAYINNIPISGSLSALFLDSAIIFFATIMLTEPLTAPPTRNLQILYYLIVAILIVPHISVWSISSTPELSLVIANIFAYFVSPKGKQLLTLKEKIKTGKDEIDFIFASQKSLSFAPGQYMEWTLSHPHTDTRGNRRYFTIASSPTEEIIHLGVRFYENGSSFKKALSKLEKGDKIVAGSLSGDFTLPKQRDRKIVFIAGGIGITPFRSMIQYLLDKKEERNIVLLYSNKVESEIMYRDVFDKAQRMGMKIVYTLTDELDVSKDWEGERGRISDDMVRKEVPDYMERTFYLSGSHTMVEHFESVLKSMGVKMQQIKKDFFPGFA